MGGDGPFQWGDIQVVTYLPADARVFSVTARKAPQAAAPQTLTVRIDGREVATRQITDNSWHTLRHVLQARHQAGRPFCIELLVDPPWYDESGRRLGVMYRDLE